MTGLGISLALLEHDALRIKQAIGRYDGLLELLTPVLDDLYRISRSIQAAQVYFRDEWESGQETRWINLNSDG